MGKMSFAEKIRSLFGSREDDGQFYDDLCDALIEGDVGPKTSAEITDSLRDACRKNHISGEAAVTAELAKLLTSYVKDAELEPEDGKTNVWMILGVNGVGKTTSAAKIAKWYRDKGVNDIVLASADTFRAAAIEQLALHGERLGIRVVSHQHGADPAAVIYDAADAVRAKGGGLVIADTAGRLHNKENLVHELEKIDRTCRQKADEGCYKRLLVIDATTGMNALRQAEVFNGAVGVDALVLTKYDSTAKGGVAVSIGKELNLPVAFVCSGEKYGDISLFRADEYIREFLGR
ncbi:MAG TPA: signal recognition particle-docking protein FtsY [Treponema sp.]|nr:signal recognition particle-docking protein FtsY [Treponema sp.]